MMNRYTKVSFFVILFGLVSLPFPVLAASVTETSAAIGKDCVASGDASTAMGYLTTASGDRSTAMGFNTTASGFASTAMGRHTTAYSVNETVIGSFSTSYSPASATGWEASDRLFVIGNGASITARSNAMVVLKNGNIGMGTSNPTNILELSSSSPKLYFNRENSESNFSGLYWRSATDNFEGAFVRNNNSGNMELYTNISGGTPRMVITYQGPPLTKL